MAAEVVGRVSTLRWKSPAGAMDNVDVVVTRQSVFGGSMKRIFRIRGVNRSMVRLDLVAVRGSVVFLEVSHGGLKLSHERLQRPEITTPSTFVDSCATEGLSGAGLSDAEFKLLNSAVTLPVAASGNSAAHRKARKKLAFTLLCNTDALTALPPAMQQ